MTLGALALRQTGTHNFRESVLESIFPSVYRHPGGYCIVGTGVMLGTGLSSKSGRAPNLKM